MQQLVFTDVPAKALNELIVDMRPASVFVLADSNSRRIVLPRLVLESPETASARTIEIPAGDDHKNLDSLASVWKELSDGGATRKSLLVNVGGGVVTDLGGFAAATFKRGIRFINVPTTLLGAVDAAVGGKTGINFRGLKNEIGAFREADAVVISTAFFNTLPASEVLSGYAEMLKHGLLEGKKELAQLLDFDVAANADSRELLELLELSVGVKSEIVASDPTERGRRKALNLGHTIGHALESLAMEKGHPVAHGYAVAWGLVGELVLSHLITGFPSLILHSVSTYIKENYGAPAITCDDYPRLLALMAHDKKNATPADINFTLLRAPGQVEINHTATPDQIRTALDILRDLLGA